jgi:hypothetical protein
MIFRIKHAADVDAFENAFRNLFSDFDDTVAISSDDDDVAFDFEDPGIFCFDDFPEFFEKLAIGSKLDYVASVFWEDMSNSTSYEFKVTYVDGHLVVLGSGWLRSVFAGDYEYDDLRDIMDELGFEYSCDISRDEYAVLRDEDAELYMTSQFGVIANNQKWVTLIDKQI